MRARCKTGAGGKPIATPRKRGETLFSKSIGFGSFPCCGIMVWRIEIRYQKIPGITIPYKLFYKKSFSLHVKGAK
jgi:hypothetical protein